MEGVTTGSNDKNCWRTIGRWENGDSIPNIHFIKILCAFFGCSADYLIGIKDD